MIPSIMVSEIIRLHRMIVNGRYIYDDVAQFHQSVDRLRKWLDIMERDVAKSLTFDHQKKEGN